MYCSRSLYYTGSKHSVSQWPGFQPCFLDAKDPQLVIPEKFQMRKELLHSSWHRPVDYSGFILRNNGCRPGTPEISYQNHILWRLVVTDSKNDVFLVWERWWLPRLCLCINEPLFCLWMLYSFSNENLFFSMFPSKSQGFLRLERLLYCLVWQKQDVKYYWAQ